MGSDQIEPAARRAKELGALDRPLITTTPVAILVRCLDPDRGLRLVDRLEELPNDQAGQGTDDGDAGDQHLITTGSRDDPSTVAHRRGCRGREPRLERRQGRSLVAAQHWLQGWLVGTWGRVTRHVVGSSS